jgi:hypothetical protein
MKYPEKKSLKNDFPTDAVLEVQYDGDNHWCRVTSNEFRSFNGRRRYINSGDARGLVATTHYYNGPVYYYGTNEVVENPNENRIIGEKFDSRSNSGRI